MNDFSQMVGMMRGGNCFGLPQTQQQEARPTDLMNDPVFIADTMKLAAKRGGDWRSLAAQLIQGQQPGAMPAHINAREDMALGDVPHMPFPGRFGDDRMAMLSFPEMLALLRRGGSGTLHPETGYPEFWGDGTGSGGGEGDHGGDSSSSGSTSNDAGAASSGGTADGTGSGGPSGSNNGGTEGGNSDGVGPTFGGSTTPGEQVADAYSQFGPDLGLGGPQDSGSILDALFGGPAMKAAKDITEGKFDEDTALNSFMGALGLSTPLGLPMAVTGIADYFGISRGTKNAEGEDVTGPGPGEQDASSDNNPGQGPTITEQRRDARAQPQFQRPAERPSPTFLNMHPGMSNLQRRAQIATFATQGQDSRYRDQETLDYWRNLIQRDLISDAGQLAEFGNVLPIELQLVSQFFGGRGGQSAPSTTQALLEAIAAS